jgi:hypothetical protein
MHQNIPLWRSGQHLSRRGWGVEPRISARSSSVWDPWRLRARPGSRRYGHWPPFTGGERVQQAAEVFLPTRVERRIGGTVGIYVGTRRQGGEMSLAWVKFSLRQCLARDRGCPLFGHGNCEFVGCGAEVADPLKFFCSSRRSALSDHVSFFG